MAQSGLTRNETFDRPTAAGPREYSELNQVGAVEPDQTHRRLYGILMTVVYAPKGRDPLPIYHTFKPHLSHVRTNKQNRT